MKLCDRRPHLTEGRGRCLDDQKPLASFFDLALPKVNGRNFGDNVDAGRQPVLEQMARDLAGFFFRGGGGQDDSFVSHIKSAVGCRRTAFEQATTGERVALCR